jgi:hypothetical protein
LTLRATLHLKHFHYLRIHAELEDREHFHLYVAAYLTLLNGLGSGGEDEDDEDFVLDELAEKVESSLDNIIDSTQASDV